MKPEQIDELMSILVKGLSLLEHEFRKLFADKLNSETRIKFLNTLKIFTYLIVEFTNFIEKKASKEAQDNDLLSTTLTKVLNSIFFSSLLTNLFVLIRKANAKNKTLSRTTIQATLTGLH